MAIDSGLIIQCADLNAVGGVKQILLTDISSVATVTPAITAPPADHTVTSMTTSADWARFEFKAETAALSINATKENGTTAYECSISFHVPNMEAAHSVAIEKLSTGCPVGIVELHSGKAFLVGFSYLYENVGGGTTPWIRNQTTANLTSIEGGSGAAYQDENGLTVTLMARQYELPLEYTGAITPSSDGLTAATA
tara:strand:- start:7159 stop:7746 length:588 start_codon:yes stop_codon:yes gene_type:complete